MTVANRSLISFVLRHKKTALNGIHLDGSGSSQMQVYANSVLFYLTHFDFQKVFHSENVWLD